jgi:hypothetical protein
LLKATLNTINQTNRSVLWASNPFMYSEPVWIFDKKWFILFVSFHSFYFLDLDFNISAISRRSVLLVEETGLYGEHHRPVARHWQTLSHNVISSTPCHERGSNSRCQVPICRIKFEIWLACQLKFVQLMQQKFYNH